MRHCTFSINWTIITYYHQQKKAQFWPTWTHAKDLRISKELSTLDGFASYEVEGLQQKVVSGWYKFPKKLLEYQVEGIKYQALHATFAVEDLEWKVVKCAIVYAKTSSAFTRNLTHVTNKILRLKNPFQNTLVWSFGFNRLPPFIHTTVVVKVQIAVRQKKLVTDAIIITSTRTHKHTDHIQYIHTHMTKEGFPNT